MIVFVFGSVIIYVGGVEAESCMVGVGSVVAVPGLS